MSSFITINGKIIDYSTKNPIVGVRISLNNYKTNTDENGNFSIQIRLPITISDSKNSFTFNSFKEVQNSDKYIPLSKNEKQNLKNSLYLNYFQKNYSQGIQTFPFDGDGNWLNDIGVIELKPTNLQLETDKSSLLSPTDEEKQALQSQINKQDLEIGPEAMLQKGISDLNQQVKTTLIPLVLTLVAQFGIDLATLKLKGFLDKKQCPINDKLLEIIQRRNKIVTQLNNLYNASNTMSKSLTGLTGLLEVLTLAIKVIKLNPTPQPAIVSSVLNSTENKLDKITKIIAGSTFISLSLTLTLKKILDLLSILDQLIQQCSQDNNLSLTAVNNELIKSSNLSNSQDNNSENYRGFDLSIEEEKTSSLYKKRHAIARDASGVIVLRGESSFSSSTSILLDELKFIIQRDNLKSF